MGQGRGHPQASPSLTVLKTLPSPALGPALPAPTPGRFPEHTLTPSCPLTCSLRHLTPRPSDPKSSSFLAVTAGPFGLLRGPEVHLAPTPHPHTTHRQIVGSTFKIPAPATSHLASLPSFLTIWSYLSAHLPNTLLKVKSRMVVWLLKVWFLPNSRGFSTQPGSGRGRRGWGVDR